MSIKTYIKKDGTTNLGIRYERFTILNLILNLTINEDYRNEISDYQISSNDKIFGIFDDIVCEIQKNDSQVKFAAQLKYSNDCEKKLTSKDLRCDKKFKLCSYLEDFRKHESAYEGFTLILYTNRKLEDAEDHFTIHDGKNKLEIKWEKCEPDKILNTSEEENCCYRFKILESEKIVDEIVEKFFKNFFLYTSQLCLSPLEQKVGKDLKKFCCEEGKDLNGESISRLENFVKSWYNCEDEKTTLNKTIMKDALVLSLLHPYIKFIDFEETAIGPKRKLLKEAILNFDVTFFKEEKLEEVKKIWRERLGSEEDIKKRFLKQYQKIFRDNEEEAGELLWMLGILIKCRHVQWKKNSNEEITELLWMLNECPLIVDDNFTSRRIITLLCSERKFILVGSMTSGDDFKNCKAFEKLSDLKFYEESYRKILENFFCTIQHKNQIVLQDLVKRNEKLLEYLSTNELIKMAEGYLSICCESENVIENYIPRSLSRTVIKPEFLNNFKDDTYVITNERKEHDRIIDDETGTSPKRRKSSKPTKCHVLRKIQDGRLEWVKSKDNIQDLRRYQDRTYNIEETDLLDFEEDNPINIICGDPGMGKTQLMMNLKNDKRSGISWTVMIYVRNHFHHFQENRDDVEAFQNYIFERAESRYPKDGFDFNFLNLLKSDNFIEVRYIWDGLDEIPNEQLEIVLKLIQALSKNGSKHWITARNRLIERLENDLNVFAMTINEFNEQQRNEYIRKRLCHFTNHSEISDHINRIFLSYSGQDILGIPLLVYILTEIFTEGISTDPTSSLSNDGKFSISKLYKQFISAKFSIHRDEKKKLDKTNTHQVESHKKSEGRRMEKYKKISFQMYFPQNICSNEWSQECREFLENIDKKGDYVGIITRITNGKNPVFCHSSFSEYFAALFIAENANSSPVELEEDRFKNIRFFLESINEEKSS